MEFPLLSLPKSFFIILPEQQHSMQQCKLLQSHLLLALASQAKEKLLKKLQQCQHPVSQHLNKKVH